jgi:hypothetical protein
MPHTPEEIPVIRNRRSSPKKGGPKPSLLCPTTGDYLSLYTDLAAMISMPAARPT